MEIYTCVYMDAESVGRGHYFGIRSVLVSICSLFVVRGVLINHVMQIQAPVFLNSGFVNSVHCNAQVFLYKSIYFELQIANPSIKILKIYKM